MVAVVIGLAALLAQGEAALAARRSGFDPFGDLFAVHRTHHRRTVHTPSAPAPSAPVANVPLANVPLPQPRPAEAPAAAPQKPEVAISKPATPGAKTEPDKKEPEKKEPEKKAESEKKESDKKAAPDKKPEPDKPVEQAAPIGPPAPQPSACRQALSEDVAIAPSIPAINGPGGCGGDDLVRLEAVVLPDKHRVSLNPAATLRCGMAAAIADWVRTDIAPLATSSGGELSGLENFDSFDCRGRNGIAGAPLSEHGRANALDVHAFKLADGRSIVLTDRDVPRSLREDVLHSACTRFTTVLGPGSDWYHEDHIHLDLMERHNNYKICQWNVWDPLPLTAPLLPEKRPDEASPRQVAGQVAGHTEKAKPGATAAPTAAKPDATASPAAKPGAAEGDAPDEAKQQHKQQTKPAATESTSSKSATKKRRSHRRS